MVHLAVGQLVRLHLLLEVQGDVAELLLDVPDDLPLGPGTIPCIEWMYAVYTVAVQCRVYINKTRELVLPDLLALTFNL